MALLKNIKYPNGTESNYHKIARMSLAKKNTETIRYMPTYDENGVTAEQIPVRDRAGIYEIEVYIRSYTSKEVRESGDTNYLKESRFYLTAHPDYVESTPIFNVVYDLLKTKPEFEGAEDA